MSSSQVSKPLNPGRTWIQTLKRSVSGVDWFLLLVILLPCAVMWYHKTWVSTWTTPNPHGSWLSLGYFLNLEESLRFTAHQHASNRLAYWIPGSLVYKLFPPLLANLLLHLCCFWIVTVALYLIVARLLGRKTALLVSSLLGCNWMFLSEIGWNCVAGVGLAYLLLTLLSCIYAGESRTRSLWLVLAGVWFAAAVNTNLILVSLFPGLALLHGGVVWLGRRREKSPGVTSPSAQDAEHNRPRLLRAATMRLFMCDGLGFSVGAVMLTLILGLYYYQVTGTLLYHSYGSSPLVAVSSDVGQETPLFYLRLKAAYWLELPFLVIVATLMFVGARRWLTIRQATTSHAELLQWGYIVVFGIVILLELLQPTALDPTGYAALLLPFMVLALAGLIAHAVESLRKTTVVLLWVAALWLTADLSQITPSQWIQDLAYTSFSGSRRSYLQFFLFLSMLGVILGGVSRRRLYAGGAVAVFLFGLTFANYSRSLPWLHFRARTDRFLAVTESVAAIKQHGYDPQDVEFWYNSGEPVTAHAVDRDLYPSIHSICHQRSTLYNQGFPTLPSDKDNNPLAPRKPVLVLITSKPGAFAEAKSQLLAVHCAAQLLEERQIQHGDACFTLTIIRTDSLPLPD